MTIVLEWVKLLSTDRRKTLHKKEAVAAPQTDDVATADGTTKEARTEHERDHDRILFATPVRRLQDKTQVFPLERNDSVRTRLTHSHEVANMARSMGTTLAFVHADELSIPETTNPKRNVPALLEAIGLAHDLGNPPFGHQGEKAIQSWMAKHSMPRAVDSESFGIFEGWAPTEAQRNDFLKFEGNAQAFRLLTRLQILNDEFGLDMTVAFLAALMKYPVPSDGTNPGKKACKKFNFFQLEAVIVEQVWRETGLCRGVRHPLTFVMEACDDIAYSVVDVEDAAKKGLINFNVLVAALEHGNSESDALKRLVAKAKGKHKEFREAGLSPLELDDLSMQIFRVYAIAEMVPAAVKSFVANKDAIMSGTFNQELMADCDATAIWEGLKDFAQKHVYSHRSVLEVELTGHKTIHELMDMFWRAITERSKDVDLMSSRKPLAGFVFSRISENYRRVAAADNTMPMRYKELQLICDMISGMSDSYAVSLCEELRRHHA